MSKKKVTGLDFGSNSIGWALLEADVHEKPVGLIDLGVRIFNKAVEDKTPTPKNQERRKCRLARRVLQRRARRKQAMLGYLVKLQLLPASLENHSQPEIVLNELGDPYKLRAKALDEPLTRYELGRVLLHLVQRRGFLSNKKTLLGQEMLDDPDVMAVLDEMGDNDPETKEKDKEETAFKKDISELRGKIERDNCRTLGEYLASLGKHACKRNRAHDGGHLRTDRQMYKEELNAIWKKQAESHSILDDDVKTKIERIIFHQRPLKLDPDRVGKCSLEKNYRRCRAARLEYQKFRYMLDINHLCYFDPDREEYVFLHEKEKEKLRQLFETSPKPTLAKIRKCLGFDRTIELNLDTDIKDLKGNTTACAIRKVLPEWDDYSQEKQEKLVEDLITIKKKPVLKNRLIQHWGLDGNTAVHLCMIEFEPGHSNLSSKAIKKMLPFLTKGEIYSKARIAAGYGYEQEQPEPLERLGPPPEIPNPIVQKGLHELRRVVNAIIAEHGKPDVIRIEMARDLEMNTKRYKKHMEQQKKNTQANREAEEKKKVIAKSNQTMSSRATRTDKIKYRLWKDQKELCAYSNRPIGLETLFSDQIEIDHILPLSQSLDDSYMNKVVCYARENRQKGNRTPKDAYGGNKEKWEQITQAIGRWDKGLESKRRRFYQTESELLERDFIANQLNDTRYICTEARKYLESLGVKITFTRGVMTDWLRHHWDLNRLLGETGEKERDDHRHHAIDAVVTACIDKGFYDVLVRNAKRLNADERTGLTMRDLLTDPPWPELRDETERHIEKVIVSHVPIRKISGALHEDTGAGFIEGVGTVYRKILDGTITLAQVNKIIDPIVKKQVLTHIEKYSNKPKVPWDKLNSDLFKRLVKEAFSEEKTVYHKDGTTPIKRVRTLQRKMKKKDLENMKHGIVDKQGKPFKWMTYGNTHHVEIIKHKKTQKYKGVFVTMMEAAHRVRGIKRNKCPVVRIDHGEHYEFLMALHINDLVAIKNGSGQAVYRIQKLDRLINKLMLRLHTASTIDNLNEEIHKSISTLMETYQMQKINVNAIGKIIE